MTRSSFRVATAVIAAVVVAGCGGSPSEPGPSSASTAPATTAQAVPEQGGIVEQRPAPDSDAFRSVPGSSVTLIQYRSTSGIDRKPTVVSGAVFVPPGAPPAGGWPVVAFGHGTTGLTDECAPSAHPNLLGNINSVVALLKRGYVVAASDFEGLGTPGPAPYLEPIGAGYNMIDAVRAARAVVPAASPNWAALGVSQGGQASWSAAELAGPYGTGLRFVGSANLSPAADLSPVVPDAGPPNPTFPQKLFLPLLITGLQVAHPDLDPTAYLHGVLAENTDVLIGCDDRARLGVATRAAGVDTNPRTPADTDRLRDWLRDMALPKTKAAGPLLVVLGSNDTLVTPQWTEGAVRRGCALGDVIDLQVREGEGHADGRALPGAVDWITDRFAGASAPNTCSQQ